MPEPAAVDPVDQLRHNALRVFGHHIQADGACAHCHTRGICTQAILAANNLDTANATDHEPPGRIHR